MKRKLIILGGGESGVGAALLGKQKGYEVFLTDQGTLKPTYRSTLTAAGIEFEEGQTSMDRVSAADEVVKSPGIPETNATVIALRQLGIPMISEIELAYRFIGDSRVLAITGTNGKSTTTTLLWHICQKAGLDAALVGNIGRSFAWQVAEAPKPFYVVEVSSFQLDDIVTFRPHVAILTNITEDHLDRYAYRMENYVRSKFRITLNQTASDVFIYNLDDEVIQQALSSISIKATERPITMKRELPHGAFIKDGDLYVRTSQDYMIMSVFDFALKGKHNQYNTMAACVAAATIDIRKEKIREAVMDFQGVEHRLEPVATVGGVLFINDSKATNVNSVWYALESMTRPTILILGGVDKGNDYELIRELVQEKVKAIVCLGTDNDKIHQAFGEVVPSVVDTHSAEEAVQTAFRLAQKGDAVLLSPACASFDLFNDYEDRGKQFKQAVRNL
ncbi:MAG: UDP-N-acetylmuramoyl-L-alanine--D-glutamate ligase [Bacteroidetes bacterium]|nr:UDP-N-acetylmuramoyl-L-alanine--D-glutamate ligase [Bacteroidota bacterium]